MLLQLDSITKTFRSRDNSTSVLRDVSLSVARGEYLAVEGPSGCGKSTLLSILGLLDVPSEGSYILDGKAVNELSGSARAAVRNREIGFIFQNFNLIGDLNAFENIELPLFYRGIGRTERRQRVASVIERLGIAYCAGRYPAQLSGGEQQRVAVARAVVGAPSVLLADEPTGNLDSARGEAVMALISDLHRDGATVILVTHDPRFAKCAERIESLRDGAIASQSAV
jgi:putative ABC transport system ATP-binding protein